MHLLTCEEDLDLGDSGLLEKGQWIVNDEHAALYIGLSQGRVKLNAIETDRVPLGDGDWNGKKVLIVRPGRFGDLVLLTPVLREIKRLWPRVHLAVSCIPYYRDALLGLSYIDDFVGYPVPRLIYEGFDAVKTLENSYEVIGAERAYHMTDLFAKRVGIHEFTANRADYEVSYDELEWVKQAFAPTEKPKTRRGDIEASNGCYPRIVIQPQADAACRTYPNEKMFAVIKQLHGRNWDIVVIGRPGQIAGNTALRFRNATLEQLTFRQSAAVLTTANVFLGMDSAMTHVAGALGVPAVALFGPFPAALRTDYAPTTVALTGRKGVCPIAPCFFGPAAGGDPFPNGALAPCARTRKCAVLDSISPEAIVAAVEKHARDVSERFS
jgi:ADP-heptose:LPS heptosyltransferase